MSECAVLTGATDLANFFSIDRASFVSACDLGINQAAAYLVLASGTGRKNDVSRWSAKAASTRLAMRWGSAKEAIGGLTRSGLIEASGTVDRPIYKLLSAVERGQQKTDDAQRI